MQSSQPPGGRTPDGIQVAVPSELPAVGRVLETASFRDLAARFGARLVAELLREEIEILRARVSDPGMSREALAGAGTAESLARVVDERACRLLAPSPRRVINATGVVIHTNLGRSVLSEEAARRVGELAAGYIDLEYDLATGGRGSRGSHLGPLLARLFPGRASMVVNNNAAAILLSLRALAKGREVVVSRGELVEIGGSFRVPEILAASGARLREVGTTNRTRPGDYQEHLGARTGAILKVHTSNFRIVGFTEEASVADLATIARAAGVPLVVDWGSGDLADLGVVGIRDEVPVARLLDDGADLVTFSGDKLLGGPQAGIIVGRADLVRRLEKDPMARALRLDRLITAALRETLGAYVRGREFEEVPTLRMLAATAAEIERRARAVIATVAGAAGPGVVLTVEPGVSRTGGGSSPTGELPTALLVVTRPGEDAGRLERALRGGDPPVIARVHEGRLLLDLRTVLPGEDDVVARQLAALTGRTAER